MVRFVFYLLVGSVLFGCSSGWFQAQSASQDEELFLRGFQQFEKGASASQAFQRLLNEYPKSSWTKRAALIIAINEERSVLQQDLRDAEKKLEQCQGQSRQQQKQLEDCRQHLNQLTQENIRLEENLEKLKSLLIELEERDTSPL